MLTTQFQELKLVRLTGEEYAILEDMLSTTVGSANHLTPITSIDKWCDFLKVSQAKFYRIIQAGIKVEVLTVVENRNYLRQYLFADWCYCDSTSLNIETLVQSSDSQNPESPLIGNEQKRSCIDSQYCESELKEEEDLINKKNPHNKSIKFSKLRIDNIPLPLQNELQEMGVYRPLWGEVEAALADGWKLEDVLALAQWKKDPRQFISRIRDNSKPPRRYYDFSERALAGKWIPEQVTA
jgi:hypothetical protein